MAAYRPGNGFGSLDGARSAPQALVVAGLHEDVALIGGCVPSWKIVHAVRLSSAIERLAVQTFDLIVVDVGLPDADRLEVIDAVVHEAPATPIIVLTDRMDQALAIEVLRRGAQDYVVKSELCARVLERAFAYAPHRKHFESELRKRVQTDALTGLGNRRAFNAYVKRGMARARRDGGRVAVITVDLDRFKSVNDRFGHHVGDELLRSTAVRIDRFVHDDGFAARLGGDEFAVVLGGAFDEGAPNRLAEGLIEALADPHVVGGHAVRISASCGVALYPDATSGTDDLCGAADRAMFEAKRRRGRVVTACSGAESNGRTRSAAASIAEELVERKELVPYFQPQIILEDGAVRCFEALLRWPSSEHLANVDVAEFIRILAERQVLVAAGTQMIEASCRAVAEWRRYDSRVRVAVNVSEEELASARFVDRVAGALRTASVAPSALELEIPAEVLTTGAPQVRTSLVELAGLGVRLMADRFGTRPSRVEDLVKYRLSGFKVAAERSAEGVRSPDRTTGALQSMADHLELTMVVTGVESLEQLDDASRQGARVAQGFMFGPPVPVGDATALMRFARDGASSNEPTPGTG